VVQGHVGRVAYRQAISSPASACRPRVCRSRT
jgi:hypothetical protein